MSADYYVCSADDCGAVVHADADPHPGEVDDLCRTCWQLGFWGESGWAC